MISYLYGQAKLCKKKYNGVGRLVYKICKLMVNLLYPVSQLFNKKIGTDQESEIVVSLTTYPARISSVWATIASLLNQTKKPCKVILWLAKEQFENVALPKRLTSMCSRGLEICYCDDLKPHKKYFYTIQKYPNKFVVTADDDIFYPEKHLEQLWNGHKKYPECVICSWSHKIGFGEDGEFEQYNKWEDNAEDEPSVLTVPVGCNGVLYPPNCFSPEVFNVEVIRKIALFTDDLWLKCMEVKNNYKAVNCDSSPLIYFNNIYTMKTGLWKSNASVSNNRNDQVWHDLMECYPEVKTSLQKRSE